MAGPCLRVHAPNMPLGPEVDRVDNFVEMIAGKIEDKDFWVSGRRFFYQITVADEEDAVLTILNDRILGRVNPPPEIETFNIPSSFSTPALTLFLSVLTRKTIVHTLQQ